MNGASLAFALIVGTCVLGSTVVLAQGTPDPAAPAQPAGPSAGAGAPAAAGEAIPALAKRYRGEMLGVNVQTRKQVSNAIEIEVTSQEGRRIAGTFSRWVNQPGNPENMCTKADKLPFTGTYDGRTISLRIKGSDNNAACLDYTWAFSQGKDHAFERQAPEGNWTRYLDPVK